MRKRSSSDGKGLLEPLRSSAVVGKGKWERKSAPLGTAFVIFQGAGVRDKELYLPLYSWVVFCDLVEAFERLAVRKKHKNGTPQIAAKALDAPDDAAGFQVVRSPVRSDSIVARLMDTMERLVWSF